MDTVCGARQGARTLVRAFRSLFDRPGVSWLLCAVLVLLGSVLRVRELIEFRPLWMDEISLAANIVFRSFADLTMPLDQYQACPVGILMLQKIMVTIFGVSDTVLRILPFVSGVAVLFLVWRVVVRFCSSPWSGALTLALTAVSCRLVYYSAEAKQYSSDVLFFLCVLLLMDGYTRSAVSGRMLVRLYLVGALFLVCSHPSTFALAGLWTVLAVRLARDRDWRRSGGLVVIGMLWAGEVALVYLCWARHVVASEFTRMYWANGFLPPDGAAIPVWLGATMGAILREWLLLPASAGALLMLCGLAVLWRRHRHLALFVIIVVVSMICASRFQLYPVQGRMMLFMVPVCYLLVAEGIGGVSRLFARRARPVGIAVACVVSVCVLWMPVSRAYANWQYPSVPIRNDMREVLAHVAKKAGPADPVFVHPLLRDNFMFYARMYGFSPAVCVYGDYAGGPGGMERNLSRMLQYPRAWFVLVYGRNDDGSETSSFYWGSLDAAAMRVWALKGRAIDAVLRDRLREVRQPGQWTQGDFISALNVMLTISDLCVRVEPDGLSAMLAERDRALLAKVRVAVERGETPSGGEVKDLNNALIYAAYREALYGKQWEGTSCLRYLDTIGTRDDAYVRSGVSAFVYVFNANRPSDE